MLLNATQTAIQEAVRAFAQDRIRPRSAAFEAAGGYPAGLFAEMAGLGLMGMTAPEEVGGAGADYVSYALALIEVAAADGALSTIVSIQNSIMVSGLLKDGNSAQQARWLPAMIGGTAIGAFALTEADAGSDAAAIPHARAARRRRLAARRHQAVHHLRAHRRRRHGHRRHRSRRWPQGISAFLAPTDTPGYFVDKTEHKLGQAASDTCALRFEDCFVGDDALLGEEGRGYGIALSNLEAGRIGIAAQSVGMAQAALEIAIAYARDRISFGKPIIEHQAVGFRLADLATRLEAARQMVLHAAALKDAGAPCLREAAMAKLFASEAAEAIVSGAIQTLGGYGYLEDFGLAKIYRDVRVCQIYEGTSDIQRMIIARAL
ncbi:acyl-CoA dehydrogenase [Polymorphobacter glacialis]|uniref:3-sulfinopropanoyl-CoA desulfinase n=1 Tax=Sandarakinorhabdus glacialis TaxID=1614636 RepID=A0A916ZWQ1_9SPHN|nr:acyl-CoA dehydrogenase [Polymorphobacter glacialis]